MISRGCSTLSRKCGDLTPTFEVFPVLFVAFAECAFVCTVESRETPDEVVLADDDLLLDLLIDRDGPVEIDSEGAGEREVRVVKFSPDFVLVTEPETGV